MILSRQLVSNNEGGKTMKEKLNAFIEDFKKEALLDVIKIELTANPTVGITQSKVGGHFYSPKSACIPTNDKGEQLMFLAQINCEELPENAIYPKKGIVQFWIMIWVMTMKTLAPI